MRMTIYLLDGCSADYVINKNNFHPVLCVGEIQDLFPYWITRKHNALTEPWEMQSRFVAWFVDVTGWI